MTRARSSTAPGLATTPEPPYFAVIFTSQRTTDASGYDAMAARMVEVAARQPGFLGVESSRGSDGLGITVSYWKSLEDIAAWRRESEHAAARDRGRGSWYSHYALRIARVERDYDWQTDDGSADPMRGSTG